MSINVRCRTSKSIHFEDLIQQIVTGISGLVVKQIDADGCDVYIEGVSSRSVTIYSERNGYEARITWMANRDDYRLFRQAVVALVEMTHGTLYMEDSQQIASLDFFSDEWMTNQMQADYHALVSIVSHPDDKGAMPEICLLCPCRSFYVGHNLLEDLGIDGTTPYEVGYSALTDRIRYAQYSRPAGILQTATNMQIELPPKSGSKHSLTLYTQNDYDMLSRADFVLLKSHEGKYVIVPYDAFMSIAPSQWERFDNCQYFTSPLDDNEYDKMLERATTVGTVL